MYQLLLDGPAGQFKVDMHSLLGCDHISYRQSVDELAVLLHRLIKTLVTGQGQHPELLIHRPNPVIGGLYQAVSPQLYKADMKLLVCLDILFHISGSAALLQDLQQRKKLLEAD